MSILRRIKFVYFLNNLFHKKELKCNEDLYKKHGLKKSVTSLLDSHVFSNKNTTDIPWMDKENIDEKNITDKTGFTNFSPSIQQSIKEWPSKGYMILSSFYSPDEVDTINTEIERLQQEKTAKNRLDHRIIFAIKQSEKIYNLATDNRLTTMLSFVMGKKVKLFQSLNFLKGSQQRAHSDTMHMTTYPLGYLIAAWVALEDITIDSGPLFYYKASHKLPYVLNDDYKHGGNYFLLGKDSYGKYENTIDAVIQQNDLQKEVFLAKKGDVFIWHANLLHGGEKILSPLSTRKSMVLHFFTEDVICYHEITQRPAIFSGNEARCPK
jgi:ectoine hydroxylase